MEFELLEQLSALSHPQRMSVYRLLMRRCPDELSAGEITQALSLKPSTASVYLSALTKAGLIRQRRDATRLLYSINLEGVRHLVSDLLFDCCRGRADICPPQFTDLIKSVTPMPDTKFNVLFVCTGNSARSIMAETILRSLAGDQFNAYSAGTTHRSELNPFAVEMLNSKKHDTSQLRSKNVSEFQGEDAPKMDFVFTVCDRAANEECPAWPGQPVSGHWGMPDPVKATGTDAEKRLAFQQTYGALRNRMVAFTSLPFASLDRSSLQKSVDAIGQEPSLQD
ncbi:metalloregulator ArsR/SmtB family transcription factor [Alphaproteobacteria bacterium KMM 3653]|uniref:Metalloregulator ArsR/SmtB family transcription factor n=1 Tax=Harenicola maris TaxID=2841044 RepID=A0AAP2G2Q0_9RHOB|nr:metalloregulator ArsR/SmtB family transcription factor [Harenicola maris]